MNKTFLTIFSATALMASTASAQDNTYIPYVGIDYGYITAKASSMKPNYNAIGFNIGTKYNPYFGTEVFYQQTGSDSKKVDADYKLKSSYRAYGLDMAAYLPIGCSQAVDLIATAGIGEYIFKKKISGGKHHNDSGWGYRFGGGFMYNINENTSLRMMARYVGLDQISDFDHQIEYTAGLRYHFL